MKKAKIFNILSCGLFFFFLALMAGGISVDAVTYEYESGKVEVESNDIIVNSFSYSYKTTGIEIFDGADDLSDNVFYSSNKITVAMDHYDAWWPLTDDDDHTYLYKYNTASKSFVLLDSYESGNYEFTAEGLYKVKYEFGNNIDVNYIFINHDIHGLSITADEKYKSTSAFNKFNFTISMKDGLDLTKNVYSYSFGADDKSLQYVQIHNSVLFDSVAPEGFVGPVLPTPTMELQEKAVSLVFDQRFVSADDNDQKHFFLKIVDEDGNEKIVYKSTDKYVLSNSIKASASIVDENGEKIEGVEKHYFKSGETINIKVVFNTPVTYTNLQYSLGNDKSGVINDSVEPVESVLISYQITDTTSFNGDFKLVTKNDTVAKVKYDGENVILDVNVSGVNFAVDVEDPVINIKTLGDENGSKDYNVLVEFTEGNLDKVYYYVAKCNISQSGNCTDSYDENNENIREAVFVEGENGLSEASIIIDGNAGKFDGVNLMLFVKAVDKSGNVAISSKYGYVIDNVIVPDNANKEEIFVFADILDGEDNVIGKKLSVVVPDAYEVNSVSYKLGENTLECSTTGVSGSDATTYECLAIENYDFRYNLEIKFVDALANEEIHNVEFKYSTIINGSTANVQFSNGSADINLYTDKKYEIEYIENNLMRLDVDEAIFSSETFNKFEQILSLNNIPDISGLVIKVVYLNGEEEVVLAEVDEEYRLPNLSELEELLGVYIDFKACAVNKCDNLEIFLKYEYQTNGVPQERFVRIKYEDNSNKYKLENFEQEKTLEYGATYVEPTIGFVNNLNSAIEANSVTRTVNIVYIDKDGVQTTVETINSGLLGKYIVRESFVHDSVKSFTLEYVVNVADTQAPTIRLNGSETIKINIGEKFKDPSVVVNDNYDQNLTILTKVEPELDTKKEGKYTISYWVVDSSGNMSEVITRTVVVEKENSITSYLIAGGIALVVIGLIVIVTMKEFKKSKRRG